KAPAADSYLWSTGETTQSIIVSSGETVTVTVSTIGGACVRTSLPTSVIVNDFLKIFPNPAFDKVSLSLIVQEASGATVAIYNTLGQKVVQQDFFLTAGANSGEADISRLRQGLYQVMVTNDEGILAKGKFVKERFSKK
ncbi:MAG: T9SS type A sorting domain-containing protein, partial [Bacteroidota bacterium]